MKNEIECAKEFFMRLEASQKSGNSEALRRFEIQSRLAKECI